MEHFHVLVSASGLYKSWLRTCRSVNCRANAVATPTAMKSPVRSSGSLQINRKVKDCMMYVQSIPLNPVHYLDKAISPSLDLDFNLLSRSAINLEGTRIFECHLYAIAIT